MLHVTLLISINDTPPSVLYASDPNLTHFYAFDPNHILFKSTYAFLKWTSLKLGIKKLSSIGFRTPYYKVKKICNYRDSNSWLTNINNTLFGSVLTAVPVFPVTQLFLFRFTVSENHRYHRFDLGWTMFPSGLTDFA